MSGVPLGGIGAEVWPGLHKAGEEAAEVAQVIFKLLARDGDPTPWPGDDITPYNVRLAMEVGDLKAALAYLESESFSPMMRDIVSSQEASKRRLFYQWHRAARSDSDPLDTPPTDHGSDRYDYVEVEAPDGIEPPPGMVDVLKREIVPCPDCRANLFLKHTPAGWTVTVAHDDSCPYLTKMEKDGEA